jgi:hypothetical protein
MIKIIATNMSFSRKTILHSYTDCQEQEAYLNKFLKYQNRLTVCRKITKSIY